MNVADNDLLNDQSGAVLDELRELASSVRAPDDCAPMWPGRHKLYEEVMRQRGLVKTVPPLS
jgi:hypothetical protein